MSYRTFFAAAALVAALLSTTACSKSEAEREEEARKAALPHRVERDGTIHLTAADRAALNLAVAPVSEGIMPSGALRFGKVESAAQDEVTIAAPVTGRLSSSNLVSGMRVGADAVIASITPAFDASERVTLGVQAADIEGQISQLEKEVQVKDAEAARIRSLARERIVSVAQQQSAAADAASAHARLDALRRERESQRRNAARLATVRSPIAGTLTEVNIPPGGIVHEGDVLARVVRHGALYVDLPVGADEPPGDGYFVLAAGTWIPARLTARGAVIDADGFRHDRIAVSSAPASLLPGAIVSVRVSKGSARGLVVPDSAVIPTSRGDIVYVQKTVDTFEQRVVHVAERADGHVRIDQGLSPGEVIVIRGAMGLYGESIRSALE